MATPTESVREDCAGPVAFDGETAAMVSCGDWLEEAMTDELELSVDAGLHGVSHCSHCYGLPVTLD